MICPDCQRDGKTISCVFDIKQFGEVCTRCERVYSPHSPRDNKHYASERAYKAAMRKDGIEGRHRSASTRALVDRILRPID